MIMRHGDYVARIEFDPELATFFGEIVNTADVITFYGSSVEELQREFGRSIEEHLAFCRRKGIKPSRPFSGKFNVRLPPETHARVSTAAAVSGKTMNAWIAETLEREARRVIGDQ
jgi:predicted HicB family RNase H-like nuclease